MQGNARNIGTWFPAWVQFPAQVTFVHKGYYPHHHVPTFPGFPCVVPCIGPHHYHVPTFPVFPCMGFNSLHGSLHSLHAPRVTFV